MARTSDPETFNRRVKRFADRMNLKGERLVRAITLGVYRDVILGTPVDTGRARSNWNLSINARDSSTSEFVEEGGKKGKQSGKTASMVGIADSKLKTGMDKANMIYISNSLPYIKKLDEGYSRQNRQGIVQPAIERAKARIEALKEL